MPSLFETKLTPALYEIFRSYKKATTVVERWLAVNSDRSDTKVRLTMSEMQQAASYVKDKRIKVPDMIYYAFDKAIRARSEVTSYFNGSFATKTAEAKNISHAHFTNTLKAIFHSLCSDRLLSSKAKETSSTSPPDSNPFETLSDLRIEDEVPMWSVFHDNETDETCYEHIRRTSDDVGDEGIKGDEVIQDLDLKFALWNLEITCSKVKTYWTDAAVGTMPVMLAAFLTNAAMANVACRFPYGQRFFEISEIIEYEEIMETYKSLTLGMPKTARSSDSIITNAFALEIQAPFIAIILCQREINGNAQQSPQSITERPQDYITSLEGPRDSIKRVDAELIVFKSLLRSIRQLPASKPKSQYDVVMGFHPFVGKIDLHNYVRPIPTSATFVLRLILESYKSWCILPGGERNVSNSRLHTLKFAQDVHKSVVRFRLSESFEPRRGCDCSDCRNPGLVEDLRLFESDLSIFTSEKRFDLYHQSPVVAGYQMTRILARATSLGNRFCNISQYVGVALHLYNFLRQLDLIDEESLLLEHLCEVIGHRIFRGPRPTLNFFSQYAAFQGMALEFGKKAHKYSVRMSEIRKSQLHPHGLSVMTGLNDCGFMPYCNRWGPVWRGVDKLSRITNVGVQKTADQIAAHPTVCALEPLESIIRPEWEGTFPVARVNWFEVFMACTEILEKISAIGCEDPRDLTAAHVHHNRDAAFTCGKTSVEDLLTRADQYERHDFVLDSSADVRVAKNAIRETLKGRKSTEFLWNV